MHRSEFRRRVHEAPLWLDGAMGTELAKRGMPAGVAPEAWVVEHPEVLKAVHADYVAAGSDLIYACTFGANRVKLADHGLERRVDELNRAIVAIAREAANGKALVFGDLSPTGEFLEPVGELGFEEAVDVYREQAAAQLAAGADGFVVETMMDLQEARAALLGVRAVAPDYPVLVSLTYAEGGRTLSGTPAAAAVAALQALGADAVGCNCSSGPKDFFPLLESMKTVSNGPLLAKPNAGLPMAAPDGGTYYDVDIDTFAEAMCAFFRMGVRLLGGCCGTTPRHIQVARAAVSALDRTPARRTMYASAAEKAGGLPAVVATARSWFDFYDPDGRVRQPLPVIGNRIGRFGRTTFLAELRAGRYDLIESLVEEQAEAGAAAVCLRAAGEGIDEVVALPAAMDAATAVAPSVPLVFDAATPEALEAVLRRYPGRAAVRIAGGGSAEHAALMAVAARYGALLLVRLADGDGAWPEALERQVALARNVRESEAGRRYGHSLLFDAAAPTAEAALAFIEQCRQGVGLRTYLDLTPGAAGRGDGSWLAPAWLETAAERGLALVFGDPDDPKPC